MGDVRLTAWGAGYAVAFHINSTATGLSAPRATTPPANGRPQVAVVQTRMYTQAGPDCM